MAKQNIVVVGVTADRMATRAYNLSSSSLASNDEHNVVPLPRAHS